MNMALVDLCLKLVLLLNFYVLGASRLEGLVRGVALQGVILAAIYLLAHLAGEPGAGPGIGWRLVLLAMATVITKGIIIPRMLFYAMREVGMRLKVESLIPLSPSLIIGAIGTGLAMRFASTLPLRPEHSSTLLVPASLATVFTGFLILTTRRNALTQVLGYLVLENGIFIFGLLLVEAMPLLVELGVLLDLFVGVFVMGIIIHHVNRVFSTTAASQLSALRE
jgi:hydrogenase-4 component E